MYVTRCTRPLNSNVQFYVDGKQITFVTQYTHLGHVISSNMNDRYDLLSKRNSVCGRMNNLVCNFKGWFLKGKAKASSLDIAPLTVLNSGTLQPPKWQLTGNDLVPRRTQWQPRARANGLLGPQLQPAGILCPSQPR